MAGALASGGAAGSREEGATGGDGGREELGGVEAGRGTPCKGEGNREEGREAIDRERESA